MSKKMKKKKMRYAKIGDFKTKPTILYEGTVNNHKVVIVNVYGRHPSAYIAVADNRVKYVEELLHCHGSVSFTGNSCFGDKRPAPKGYTWVGWDYGHLCDYTPPLDKDHKYSEEFKRRPRYTTEQVYAEIKEAVKDLILIEEACAEFNFESRISNSVKTKYPPIIKGHYAMERIKWKTMMDFDANGDYNNPPSPAYWYKNWILGMKSLGFTTKERRRKIFEYIIQIIDMEVRDCE